MVEIEEIKQDQQKGVLKYSDVHKEDKDGKEESGSGGIADVYQLLAIGFGGACYFFKTKWAAWLCLYFFYSSVINMGSSQLFQQGTASFGLVSIAFVQCYLAPDPAELERRKRAQEILRNPELQISEK